MALCGAVEAAYLRWQIGRRGGMSREGAGSGRGCAMTSWWKIARLFAVCLAGLTLAGVGSACALDYPNRPVRWIVGYPPGGTTDILARIVGQWLSERLG